MPVKGNGKTSNHQTNNYERDTKRDSSSTEEFKHSNGNKLIPELFILLILISINIDEIWQHPYI